MKLLWKQIFGKKKNSSPIWATDCLTGNILHQYLHVLPLRFQKTQLWNIIMF